MSATVVQYPIEPHVSPPHAHLLGVNETSHVKQLATRTCSPRVTVARSSLTPLTYTKHEVAPEDDGSERIALVLDMDECLVHSIFQNENHHGEEYRQEEYRPKEACAYEDSFEIVMEDGERAVVNKRPGLEQFLAEASKHFDLYVYTAGLEAYGRPILDALDPKGTIFTGRFFREACQMRKGMFLKDLSVVRRDLSKVILVDNNPVSFLMQPSNGIPVPSFFDDATDHTLQSLTKVIMSLRELDDVRPRLHQLFRLADLLSEHRRMILP